MSNQHEVLVAAAKAWARHPDWPFGQLVARVTYSHQLHLWTSTDTAWEAAFNDQDAGNPDRSYSPPGDGRQYSSRANGYRGLPVDSGEYADGLQRILDRISHRDFQQIACDRGWFALLVALDEELAALCPDYEVLQVKQKLGGLSFYWRLPASKVGDSELFERMTAIVNNYTALASRTCEQTGAPGILMNAGGTLRTLDPVTADDDFTICTIGSPLIPTCEEALTTANRLLAALRAERAAVPTRANLGAAPPPGTDPADPGESL